MSAPQTTATGQATTPERRAEATSAAAPINGRRAADATASNALLALVRLLARQAAIEAVRSAADSPDL
jgi:hypothetical protein